MKPFMPKLVYFEPKALEYRLGFIVAPIYMHEGWEEGYRELFERLYNALKDMMIPNLTFELIQHRFTKPAKKVIQVRYPNTKLEMDEEKRKYKWGRYGIGKYVYKKMTQKYWRKRFEDIFITLFLTQKFNILHEMNLYLNAGSFLFCRFRLVSTLSRYSFWCIILLIASYGISKMKLDGGNRCQPLVWKIILNKFIC
jgi:hypothetical protein